jgi:hypothetical protein
MYEDEIKKVDAQIKKLKDSEEIIQYLNQELNETRVLYNRLVAQYQNSDPMASALYSTQYRAPKILLDEAMQAVKQTKEFDLPLFTERLSKAILDPKTIELSINKYDHLSVKINLKTTAGTTKEYLTAVKIANQALGLGKSKGQKKTAPGKGTGKDLPSWFWQEKYYSPAREGTSVPIRTKSRGKGIRNRPAQDLTERYKKKYFLTIETRVSYFTKPAPFWEIINNGTPKGKGSGEPYPVFGPTNFVSKAIKRMQDTFERFKRLETELERDLAHSFIDLQHKMEYIHKLIHQYSKPEDLLEKTITERFKNRFPNADPAKVNALIEKLLAGEEVANRVEVTRHGSGGRAQIRTKSLRALVEKFRSR